MNTEKMIELIDNSEMAMIEKNINKGFILRAEERFNSESGLRSLINSLTDYRVDELLYTSEEVAVYSVYGADDWDIKYPIRFIYFKNDVWNRSSLVFEDFEKAILGWLGFKYLGDNTQFSDFASKMLGV